MTFNSQIYNLIAVKKPKRGNGYLHPATTMLPLGGSQ